MRLVFLAFSAFFLASTISGGASAQVDKSYSALASDIVSKAEMTLKSGDAVQAQFLFERALTADPANVRAMIGLGQAHEKQGRIGRGLKYYRQALDVQRNNVRALEAQALAFLKRDIVDRTKANLDKLKELCATCEATQSVEKALDTYMAENAKVAVNESEG